MRSGLLSFFFAANTDRVKILITTIFFPPQNLIASLRPYVWARTWALLGHDVFVLTIEKDKSAPDRLNKSFDGFNVTQIDAGPIIRRVRRHRQAVGSVENSSQENALFKLGFRASAVSWLKRRGLMSSVRWPDAFDLVLPQAWRSCSKIQGIDVIVSSFGPHASLAMGYFAKLRNPQAKWVLDFRDLWRGNHVYSGIWPFRYFEAFLESFYVGRADLIVTVSAALARELQARYPEKRVTVSPNGFDPEETAACPKLPEDFNNARFTIVYTGSLHEEQRNPRPLFSAIASLSPSLRPKIQVKVAGPIADFVPKLIADYGLSDCVEILGKLPRDSTLRIQAEADVLLFLEKQHVESRDGVLTGKLFEYLVTGRPIWAIGITNQSMVGQMLLANSVGQAFGDDVESIKAALESAIPSGRQKSRDINADGEICQKYNRVTLAQQILSEIVRSAAVSPSH